MAEMKDEKLELVAVYVVKSMYIIIVHVSDISGW